MTYTTSRTPRFETNEMSHAIDDRLLVFEDATVKSSLPKTPFERPALSFSRVTVFDVAEYILRKMGTMGTIRLQKLVYYCQAWSLVWDESPLFPEKIEAWANGPVIRKLFDCHRGFFEISSVQLGNPDSLSDQQRETVDAVLFAYKDIPTQGLIEISHNEAPWKNARKNIPDGAPSCNEITLDSMAQYYSSLR